MFVTPPTHSTNIIVYNFQFIILSYEFVVVQFVETFMEWLFFIAIFFKVILSFMSFTAVATLRLCTTLFNSLLIIEMVKMKEAYLTFELIYLKIDF